MKLRWHRTTILIGLVSLVLVLRPPQVCAQSSSTRAPNTALASEIAVMSDRACLRALQRARVPFERVQYSVAGIATPVRIRGRIEGVRYRANERPDVYELMDCRFAMALVHFSQFLRGLGIVEVQHYSIYRPPDERTVANRPIQARHGGGLALDAAWFIHENGERFSVERDFEGERGTPACGPEAQVPHGEAAQLLRTIACNAAQRGIFHVILTPNYNYQHRNHFHIEITRGVAWQILR